LKFNLNWCTKIWRKDRKRKEEAILRRRGRRKEGQGRKGESRHGRKTEEDKGRGGERNRNQAKEHSNRPNM
jgi:hypothetical protein